MMSAEDIYLMNNLALKGPSATNEYQVLNATDFYNMWNIEATVSITGSLTRHVELNVNDGFLTAPQLPTSTPGGSDRIWANSNVLNIT